MKKLNFILAVGFLMFNSGLYACSCIGQRTVREEIKNSDVVLTGKIISKNIITLVDSTAVKLLGANKKNFDGFPFEISIAKYELALITKYKGRVSADTIEVYTGLGGGDCGVKFTIGKEYVVYGKKETFFGQDNNDWTFPKGRNIYWADICSRTTIINREEITEIEKYRKKR